MVRFKGAITRVRITGVLKPGIGTPYPERKSLWAEALADGDDTTGFLGKWHCGENLRIGSR
tara:strand:- start:173 stop:355 length:183 start_codon:yes stop_codon:yes gene_type:complete